MIYIQINIEYKSGHLKIAYESGHLKTGRMAGLEKIKKVRNLRVRNLRVKCFTRKSFNVTFFKRVSESTRITRSQCESTRKWYSKDG